MPEIDNNPRPTDISSNVSSPTVAPLSTPLTSAPSAGGNGYAERLMKVEFQVEKLSKDIQEVKTICQDNTKSIENLKVEVKALDNKVDNVSKDLTNKIENMGTYFSNKFENIESLMNAKFELIYTKLSAKSDISDERSKITIGLLVALLVGVVVLICKGSH
ncbi:MAG: hypothetical protein LBR11_08045 [Deltaproteobacteria bacterium]|jgi:hypothetical protein|nr:hypothetical protein [Deltaproteobacteria bacterium]